MAGIGFALKRMFQKESFSSRALAYLYSSFIAAGPWIISVVSINLLLLLMKIANVNIVERNLFSATIVYSFIFSQLIVAPFQLVVTRYISDKLYLKKYEIMKPTFQGLASITFFISLCISIIFYFNKPLPIYYKIFSTYLFVIVSLIWVLIIFLSAVKNYKLIGKAYLYGGILSLALIFYFLENPIKFNELSLSTNFLIAYVVGLSLIFIVLLLNFFSTFHDGSIYKYDFIRYFGKHSVLCLIGLFYTLGLWIDNLILWFSDFKVKIYDTFIFAPFYDNAVFLAYLTTIVTLVLFLVTIETEFYSTYKKYFENANSQETLNVIENSKNKMIESLKYNLFYTFTFQFLITLTLVLIANPLFKFLEINYYIRDFFKITAIGAFFNISAFILLLILLYFEKRAKALIISICFFFTNTVFTIFFLNKPIEYTGFGFLIGSFITFILSILLLFNYFKNINYSTFALQPIYLSEDNGFFTKMANKLNSKNESKSFFNKTK